MYFTLPIKPVTKKNHSQLITLKTGKQILLPSKQYKTFEKEVCNYIKDNVEFETIDYPINLKCLFYKDKDYKSDLTGYLQAIQDVLVKAKVLKDDNHKIVESVDGSKVLLDRKYPRITIEIERI